LPFDYLVVATGSTHSYFGHDAWQPFAPGLKSIDDATTIRRRILSAFEAAEMETDAARRDRLLRFVIVGAGPTGVELAGTIAELARFTLAADFRRIDPRSAKIVLVEAGPRVLAAFKERSRNMRSGRSRTSASKCA
jgi:NADH dehydrogenase